MIASKHLSMNQSCYIKIHLVLVIDKTRVAKSDVSVNLEENSIFIDIKSFNYMSHIYDKYSNNITGFNLLCDILSPSKRSKYINTHCSPILNEYMNRHRGSSKY